MKTSMDMHGREQRRFVFDRCCEMSWLGSIFREHPYSFVTLADCIQKAPSWNSVQKALGDENILKTV